MLARFLSESISCFPVFLITRLSELSITGSNNCIYKFSRRLDWPSCFQVNECVHCRSSCNQLSSSGHFISHHESRTSIIPVKSCFYLDFLPRQNLFGIIYLPVLNYNQCYSEVLESLLPYAAFLLQSCSCPAEQKRIVRVSKVLVFIGPAVWNN